MGARETDDPVKSQLLKASAQQRQELEHEVKALSEDAERVITTALLVGGVLLLSYMLYTELAGGSKKKKKKEKKDSEEHDETESQSSPGLLKQVGTTIANHAALYLLDVAREKLAAYLESQKPDHESS